MAIHSIIQRDHGIVQTTCTGNITFQDIIEYQQDIWINGNVTGFHEIFDAQQGDFSSLSMPDVLEISQHAIQINKNSSESKLAFVVQPGEQEQMVKFYCSTQEINSDSHRTIRAFHQLADALSWVRDKTTPDQ